MWCSDNLNNKFRLTACHIKYEQRSNFVDRIKQRCSIIVERSWPEYPSKFCVRIWNRTFKQPLQEQTLGTYPQFLLCFHDP